MLSPSRILLNMLYLYVGVNTMWFILCSDVSGFKTMEGFADRLLSILGWMFNALFQVFN